MSKGSTANYPRIDQSPTGCLRTIAYGCIVILGMAVVIFIFSRIFFIQEPTTAGTGVDSPLYMTPSSMITHAAGILLVQPGQELTAFYTVTNDTKEPSASSWVGLHAIGPRACELDWEAPNRLFILIENFVLEPGDSKRIEGKLEFTEPGLYFAESNEACSWR